MAQYVLERDARNIRAWRALLDASIRLEAWADEVAVATKILELRPKPNEFRPEDLQMLYRRSHGLEKLGKLKEALEALDQLASKAPQDLSVNSRRSLVRAQCGMLEGAREDFEKVLSSPSNPNMKEPRGWAMLARSMTIVGEAQAEAEDEKKRQIDTAMQILRDAINEGGVPLKEIPMAGPFAAVRENPAFTAILAQVQSSIDAAHRQLRESSCLGVQTNPQQEARLQVASTVRDSAARRGGLMPNDTILAVNGTAVRAQPELVKILTPLPVGAKISLKFERTIRANFKIVQVRELTLTDRTIFLDR